MTPQLLTTKEAAEMLRLCPQSVRDLCDQKRLACIRHRPGGHRKIPREAIERYIATLTDSVETYTPAVVEYCAVEDELDARIKRLKRVK